MKFRLYVTALICIALAIPAARSQSLPVGTPALEDYIRRSQLSGGDSALSFTIRPVSYSSHSIDVFFPGAEEKAFTQFSVLPVSWQQQFTTRSPYGWNDGLMIPARGYQTTLSGGVYARLGPLSIQLKPEFVYARNRDFSLFRSGNPGLSNTFFRLIRNVSDVPEQFGHGAYAKATLGQSSIRLNAGPVSLGFSNENIWWGPGIRNSIILTNSAPGFRHVTFNTSRPVSTPVGSFEAQVVGGRLEGSGITPDNDPFQLFVPYSTDWRYFSGIIFTYSPRWTPGLFIGVSRAFNIYHSDLKPGFRGYLPFLDVLEKKNSEDEDFKGKDQVFSFFSRWVWPEAKAEIYIEYGRNDHSYNTRDFLIEPDHARAYIFGIRKLIPLNRTGESIGFGFENTNMASGNTRMIRYGPTWYVHPVIRHGYTNRGEVLGAGIGPGSNLVSNDLSWHKGLNKSTIQVDWYWHNLDYSRVVFNGAAANQWKDVSVAAQADRRYRNFLINAEIRGIFASNYKYEAGNDPFNFYAKLGLAYYFE
ncbi:capsule assembly Wzi family protein [Hufsiella ginkgonis]|uniref:Capsule assembly Wzi family protein n=1 Tax=Hufsiella ginkgonis TaxID=2695274 RepID=A0A7K1Y2A4_9SPHI|nr:capsule assembly Wzi family protein [Hufsiella ginkgonis]MXV17385.1 hypothetical protein [Hufsiella ginkgonis]